MRWASTQPLLEAKPDLQLRRDRNILWPWSPGLIGAGG
jgi:O-succinylbenzoate synthase